MRLFRRITRKFAALLLPLMASSSCDVLHDDLSKCDFFLRFVYDYNMERQDFFAAQVSEVQVFVFDPQGGYVQTLAEKGETLRQSGYRMHIPYALKGYTFVVWAGKTGTYYTLPALQAGDPASKLTLGYEPQSDTSNAHIDPIWHSGPSVMTFPEEQGTAQTISLVRTTNDIRVALQEKNEAPADPARFEIALTGANNTCDYTHALLNPCRTLTYVPCTAASTPTAAWLYTMRMVEGNGLRFSVTEKATGRFVTLGGKNAIDLTEFVLEGKPEGMGAQEYLDRRYEWEITLSFDPASYLALSITINGWKHWFQDADQ